jgi:DNA-binding response OmpR family regulator
VKKILVIEDNGDVRENVAEILELSQYKVITAENGKAGVELALLELPDLIVCDIMMPVLDGYGVLHMLNQHTETSGTPFIFLTAKSEKSDLRKGMELGADDYITKPFEGIELLSAIERRLKKSDFLKVKLSSALAQLTAGAEPDNQSRTELLSDTRDIADFKSRQILYSAGQRPKRVFYILEGKVKTAKTSHDGKELITHIFGPGDFLGYTPILEGLNYAETAEILEDARLMLIPRDEFIKLISEDLHITRQFLQIISKNVSQTEEQLVNLAYNSLRRKVAYGLLQIFDKFRSEHDEKEIFHISRENLAQVTGVAKESLIRTLSDFKDEKLIELLPGKIRILNEAKLRNLPF